MLLCAAYGVRRRLPGWHLGSLHGWKLAHVSFGVLALALAVTHSGAHLSGSVAGLSLSLFCLVGLTGALGLLLSFIMPKSAAKLEETDVATLTSQIDALDAQLGAMSQGRSSEFQQMCSKEIALMSIPEPGSWRCVFAGAKEDADREGRLTGQRKFLSASEQRQIDQVVALFAERERLANMLKPLLRCDCVLSAWVSLHVPLAAALLVMAVAHVVSVAYY